jgi:hypothetical protein
MTLKTLFDSKCQKDAKNRHYWERIGCDAGFIIYQCSQCNFCVRRRICFLEYQVKK